MRIICKEFQNPQEQICRFTWIYNLQLTFSELVSMNLQAFVKHMVHKEPFPILVESLQTSLANHPGTYYIKSLSAPISKHDNRLSSQLNATKASYNLALCLQTQYCTHTLTKVSNNKYPNKTIPPN